jgi:hypothetical protein
MSSPSVLSQSAKPLLKCFSAKKVGSFSRSRLSGYSCTLNKPSSSLLPQEKDTSSLETLVLRTQLSEAVDRNSRLQAEVLQLRTDLERVNGAIAELTVRADTTQLVSKLKKLVRELKREIDSQRAQIDAFKKMARVTQCVELEAEKQIYVGECVRLRRLLDAALADKAPTADLTAACLSKGETGWPDRLSTSSPNLPEMQRIAFTGNSSVTNQPVTSLLPRASHEPDFSNEFHTGSFYDSSIEEPSSELKHISFIITLSRQLRAAQKDLGTVLSAYSPQDSLSADELYAQLSYSGVSVSEKEVVDMWKALFQATRVQVTQVLMTLERVEGNSYDQPSALVDSFSLDQLSDDRGPAQGSIIQHLALRMQMHRVSCEAATQLLAKVQRASLAAQQSMLAAMPFECKDADELRRLTELLRCTSLADLAKQLGTWHVMEDAEEEERFDAQLSSLLRSNKAYFLATCETYDDANSGSISLTDFFAAARACGLDFSPRLKLYLQLLCYSYDYKLASAPYRSLVEAFTKSTRQSAEAVEEDQMVRRLLKEMVVALQKSGLPLSSVFKADAGLISPVNLLEGLNSLLEIEVKRKEFIALMAALRSDRYENPVVDFNELEDFLADLTDTLQSPEFSQQMSSLSDSSQDLKRGSLKTGGKRAELSGAIVVTQDFNIDDEL